MAWRGQPVIVVKVGGSLFDHPKLGLGLRAYLDSLEADVLLVPGGGDAADAVRTWDATHHFGEVVSHWLALRALDVTSALLRHLLLREPPTASAVRVLDCLAFSLEDDERPGALPHSWGVTTDSIAARAAVVYEAERLVLLKSVNVDVGTAWEVAAERGWVDPHFPRVVADAAFPVEVVNFRRVLDSLGG